MVYAKRPFGGPDQVMRYLGRYTHKVAITNWRLVSHEGGLVRFRYRDRAAGDVEKTLTLPEGEFLRRFLQHVLPRGFQRLRQYGLLANSCKREKLARCRELLEASPPERLEAEVEEPAGPVEIEETAESSAERRCPRCGQGRLARRVEIERGDPRGLAMTAVSEVSEVSTANRGPPMGLASRGGRRLRRRRRSHRATGATREECAHGKT